jgi:hypothetical protein
MCGGEQVIEGGGHPLFRDGTHDENILILAD